MKIYITEHVHKRGNDVSAFSNREGAEAECVRVATEGWTSMMGEASMPDDDHEMAIQYFRKGNELNLEFFEIREVELKRSKRLIAARIMEYLTDQQDEARVAYIYDLVNNSLLLKDGQLYGRSVLWLDNTAHHELVMSNLKTVEERFEYLQSTLNPEKYWAEQMTI